MTSLFSKGALPMLLLMLGMANAFASPRGESVGQLVWRSVQFGPFAQEAGERPKGARNENRGGREGGGAAAPRREHRDDFGAPNGGRQGRMTPDERRALRRQINEAGQDIYRQKR
ncbi:MAG: hypothetical protein A3K04_00745 [Gallionellales bacterium RBG_16_56_9]|nr:MAG: hypothetical protein A3K04_00745 [Gallionellales bacterium RBG_16_56_9]